MTMNLLKVGVATLIASFWACPSGTAQTMAEGINVWAAEWKQAFSAEGRKAWKPEITLRIYAGLPTEGTAATAGIKIDSKRTIGLMAWQGRTYSDANPSDTFWISVGLYKRRYFPITSRDIVAFYSDIALGAGYVYRVDGFVDREDYQSGDVFFSGTWQPGIRVRIWRNTQLFLGLALANTTMGLHLGVGF